METEEILTIAAIKQRYPDEWVLVVDCMLDEKTTTPLRGRVFTHSKSREEIDRALEKLQSRATYVFNTGEIPKDVAILFLWRK